MRPSEAARKRGVTEILHYTTRRGALGILATKKVLSRKRLDEDEYLENVATPACDVRFDPRWLDCVNLSVARINAQLFGIVENRHLADRIWWVVLAFGTEILDHEGVVFTTTNNIYPSVRRGTGTPGFEAMFDDPVFGRYAERHTREGVPDDCTTDRQAEILYPGELSTEYLRGVYCRDEMEAATIRSQQATLQHPEVPVEVRPDAFL